MLKLASEPNAFSLSPQDDLLQAVLDDRRSPNTKRVYARALKDFFTTVAGDEPSPALVGQFLGLERFTAVAVVLKYKAGLQEKGLAPSTINVRLAAIKALVDYARRIGKCDFSLADVKSVKVQAYRDTSGIGLAGYKQLMAAIDTSSLPGKRDYALVHLLWSNALRRGEVSLANLKDFDPGCQILWVQGKGQVQKEAIALSPKTVAAIEAWLQARGETNPNAPLFCALDRATWGGRMSGNGIYKRVRTLAKRAGIEKSLSPHQIRHSAITAALDATSGDVRRVQKLSRHASLDTLLVYDDRRREHQREVSGLLADLL